MPKFSTKSFYILMTSNDNCFAAFGECLPFNKSPIENYNLVWKSVVKKRAERDINKMIKSSNGQLSKSMLLLYFHWVLFEQGVYAYLKCALSHPLEPMITGNIVEGFGGLHFLRKYVH